MIGFIVTEIERMKRAAALKEHVVTVGRGSGILVQPSVVIEFLVFVHHELETLVICEGNLFICVGKNAVKTTELLPPHAEAIQKQSGIAFI